MKGCTFGISRAIRRPSVLHIITCMLYAFRKEKDNTCAFDERRMTGIAYLLTLHVQQYASSAPNRAALIYIPATTRLVL